MAAAVSKERLDVQERFFTQRDHNSAPPPGQGDTGYWGDTHCGVVPMPGWVGQG